MPEEIAGSPQFHALVAVAPTGQKGGPLENRQVSESKARAIREDAGQAGKGFGPAGLAFPIHDRMPIILDPDGCELWLDPGITNVSAASDLLRPFDTRLMRCYP